MDLKQRHLVNKYVDLILRRKLLIAFFLLVSLPLGLGVYMITPKVYQSSSLLSYQQQKITSAKYTANIASRIRDTVSSLTQIVTSRTNLEYLIDSLNLYPDEMEKLPMEDIVDSMRKKIKIDPSKQGDIFQITFVHGNPQKVVRVTNALASKFIEENLKYREERATETSAYTGDELRMAKEMMDRKERGMRDYKVKYYNEMPEQRVSNVSRLIALQQQYQGKQESIQDLERTLVLIQDQLNNRKTLLAEEQELADARTHVSVLRGDTRSISKAEQLRRLQRLLQDMLTRYTEKHPEVRQTKSVIGKLEKEIASDKQNGIDDDTVTLKSDETGFSEGAVTSQTDKIILQLETQHKNVMLNIRSIKEEKDQLKSQIAQYEEWVTAAPVREAEWSSLTREYGQLKRHYEYLVAQDLEAKSMLNLERRQKGGQFKIEDPARLPEKPVKPNFIIVMGLSVLSGLIAGLGLTLGLDFFDSSLRDPEVVEASLGVPLLSTVPYVATNVETIKSKRVGFVKLGLFLLSLFLIGGLFVYVWIEGYIVI